uniref:Uncharacterized protein n=1 Tax=viral metagenome TaxID=1070528 RepID=A0A6C0B407_9ZZZZ
MGITFSTQNYEKIINLIEEPYLNDLKLLNNNLIEAVNIDNDNRKLVYKHRTRDTYLLYCGGICNVSQCFEVNENFLLKQSHHFTNFYALKDFILKNYPKSELVLELIKYESQNYIDIIDVLEKGELNEVVIDFDFTDSESDYGESSEEETTAEEPIINKTISRPAWTHPIEKENIPNNASTNLDNNIFSNDWVSDWNYDSLSFNNNVISNWEYNYGDFCFPINDIEQSDNKCPQSYSAADTIFPDFFPYTSMFDMVEENACQAASNACEYSDIIIRHLDADIVSEITKQAVKIAKDASVYADNIVNDCTKDILTIKKYNKAYLEAIEEDLNYFDSTDDSSDYNDDDLIFPNMNYFKRFK